MESIPFRVNIDFGQDTTGIIKQIFTVKKVFKQLENEIKKLDTLINESNINMEIIDENNKTP